MINVSPEYLRIYYVLHLTYVWVVVVVVPWFTLHNNNDYALYN